MPVDIVALVSFLEEVNAWYESGSPRFWQKEEQQRELRELRDFQERARVFAIECDGAPLSMAWFKEARKIIGKAAQEFVELWFSWSNYHVFEKVSIVFGIESAGEPLSRKWFEDLARTFNFDLPAGNKPSI